MEPQSPLKDQCWQSSGAEWEGEVTKSPPGGHGAKFVTGGSVPSLTSTRQLSSYNQAFPA